MGQERAGFFDQKTKTPGLCKGDIDRVAAKRALPFHVPCIQPGHEPVAIECRDIRGTAGRYNERGNCIDSTWLPDGDDGSGILSGIFSQPFHFMSDHPDYSIDRMRTAKKNPMTVYHHDPIHGIFVIVAKSSRYNCFRPA